MEHYKHAHLHLSSIATCSFLLDQQPRSFSVLCATVRMSPAETHTLHTSSTHANHVRFEVAPSPGGWNTSAPPFPQHLGVRGTWVSAVDCASEQVSHNRPPSHSGYPASSELTFSSRLPSLLLNGVSLYSAGVHLRRMPASVPEIAESMAALILLSLPDGWNGGCSAI